MADSKFGLLPCPFCGAPARTDLLPHVAGPGWVQCSECECDQHMSDTLDEAVAKWNRRAVIATAAQPAVQRPEVYDSNGCEVYRSAAPCASQPAPAATVETFVSFCSRCGGDDPACYICGSERAKCAAASVKAPFHFRRYVDGVEMAEDVEIANASTAQEAFAKARALYGSPKGMDLVLEHSPTEAPATTVETEDAMEVFDHAYNLVFAKCRDVRKAQIAGVQAAIIAAYDVMTPPQRCSAATEGETKTVYVKRWRTLVKLPAKYADEIVAALRIPVEPQAVKVPEGYALVPLIPTQEMIEVGCENNSTQWNEGTDLGFAADVALDVYVSMVRTASQVSRPHGGIEDCDCVGAVIGQHDRSCPLASQQGNCK